MIVYHGTYTAIERIDLSKSLDKRDFGVGFYTTTDLEQAKRWALNRHGKRGLDSLVITYEIESIDGLKVKRFQGANKLWLEFVAQHRRSGGIHHEYDIVIGPVADDTVFTTINLFIEGIYTADEALKRLKLWKNTDQVSFHTEKAISRLIRKGREHVGNDSDVP